ncbi:MAG: type VI secretion system-associated protein TagF [Rhodospirillaceae bacterium]|nr:type VI secretion system-associated protein TagF [Rhodospirillaceae bacterium]MCA8932114.1 type VI secretion system-associated protein TagF [Rhodospirillaceae bacterium]
MRRAANQQPAPPPELGFYGKLPSRGDFVSRALTRRFIDPWDRWLQQVMEEADPLLWPNADSIDRAVAGCRFALMPGVCGPEGLTGLLVPSFDRVGRRFPLTVAVALPTVTALAGLPAALTAWFGALDSLVAACMSEQMDFEDFQEELADFDTPAMPANPPHRGPGEGIAANVPAGQPVAAGFAPLLDSLLLDDRASPYSLWWSHPTDHDAGRVLLAQGLPAPARVAEILTWQSPP